MEMPCGGEAAFFSHGEQVPPPGLPNSQRLASVESVDHHTVGPFDKQTSVRKTSPPMKDDNIVISGISGRYPDCDSIAEFWEKLVSGVELSSVDDRRWPVGYLSLPKRSGKIRDISKCDYEFFGLTEHEANYMDVQMRLALETTYEAIVDAGMDPADLRGTKTGIFAGICYDDTGTAFGQDEQTALHYLKFSVQRIAAAFDFRGGASSTDTACASSFSAFYQAYYSLKAGLCDHALVIGAAVNLRPTIALGFNNLRMTSQDGRSKCMDASADGYGRSEAVVSILLQRDTNAKRVYAQVLNVQTNTDGFKSEGITYPSIESQHRLMRATQELTGIHPHEMKYVEAHMTGTPAGDVVESESIRRTFCEGRKDPLLMGCLKSNLGHTEGASGTCAISKVCLAFENKELPPNLHFNNPNLNIEGLKTGALKPVTERMPFHENIVGVSSFGFGGCNVYCILKANETEPSVHSFASAFNHSVPRLVAACGRTKEAVESVFTYVDDNKEQATNEFFALLNDAMKTDVSKGMMYRGYSIFEGKNVSQKITRCRPEAQPVWLALSGVCTQWKHLSRSLMNVEPFAKSIIQSHVIALNMGLDLQDILFEKTDGTLKLHEAMVGITATQIALIDVLSEMDLKIDGIIGHSIGEIACAYADGCMSREQTICTAHLVAKQLMNSSTRNGMTGLEWEEIGVHTEKVKSLYSSIRDELSSTVFTSKPKKRSSRWISTSVTSETFDVDEFMSASYFANAITTNSNLKNVLYLMPKNAVVLEVSSQPILEATMMKGLGPDITFVPMMQPASTDEPLTHLLSAIGIIYASGNNLSIEKLYPKVEYPVPRGTLPISPLIKWDHNKSCVVTRYPEYFSVIRGVASYDIDLIQSAFQYLSGHVIDGRNLCPAVEYLRFVWENVVANLFGSRDYMKYPIEFRKVKLMRGIMLSRHKSIEVTVKYERETGAFETMEGGNLCCSGYAFLAADPSTQSLEDLVQPTKKPDAVMLDHKSIYKELRVRGYDYGQTFQGLTEASSDGTYGKVKWMGHWVSFVDSMLQIAIMGSNERVLRIPTYIEYVKCNSQIFMENIEKCKDEMGESVVDVHFDKTVGVGASKGIVIMGLKTSAIARRNAQQPVLESYNFVPNRDTGIKITSPSLEGYLHECSFVIDLLKSKQSNPDMSLHDLSEGEKAMMESIKGKVETRSAGVSLLAALYETLASSLSPAEEPLSLPQILTKQLHVQSNCLANDMTCVTALESEKVTRHQIDMVIENSSRDMKVLELNPTTGLLADQVADLLNANLIQTTYNVLHTELESALTNKGPARLTDLSKLMEKSVLIPSDFVDQDLIIMRDESLQPLPRISRLSVRDFLNASFKAMKQNAFFLLFGRSGMTPLEQEVMALLGEDGGKTLTDPKLLSSLAQEIGFEVVALKSEACMNLFSLLLRKRLEQPLAIKVIQITGSGYDWINEVKDFLLPQTSEQKSDEEVKKKIQEKKEQLAKSRLWLTSGDPSSGLIGLINCLRREPGCESVRCFASPMPTQEIPDDIMRLDLVMNITQDSEMGSYRHTLVESPEVVQQSSHAYVDIKTKGDLSSFRWLENGTKHFDATPESCRTSPNELLVKVNYAALNFKDVMIASGRISSDAYPSGLGISGAMLGMEFSGHDMNGNRVMGYTIGKGMATEVSVLDPLFLWPVPANWTLGEAATVPVVYTTVYYGLMVRAGLRRGESVLIHSGAGGVGQAAINVCQSMGCQILTTCSDEKRSFLKKTFGLEDWQIANSRNTSFEEHILRVTDGRGIDVVLNSLSESKLKASVNCLAEYGRFVEIGKYDIVVNNLMDMSQFGQNKAFQTTCLAHLDVDAFFNKNPVSVNARTRVYDMMSQGIREGVVRPLQSHVYDKDEVEEAFRFMASGKHIGKVLIKIADEESAKEVRVPAVQQTLFHPNKSYVVTGGLGGFGLELTYWMTTRGAKNIILTSRNGIKDNYQKVFLDRLKEEAFGVRILISTKDVSSKEGAEALLREAASLAPVGGIFNLAMVLKDATLENQSVETFTSCCGPKVEGTSFLDEISRNFCPQLDHFVCFSSVVSGRGNAGQTNYGYANSVMERVCEKRKRDGLPALAIQWGAIGDVGVVAEVLGGNDVVIGGTSVPQRLPSCLEVLDQFMTTNYAVVSSIVKVNMKKTAGGGKGDLLGTVCHILGIRDPSSLDPNSTLSELGMDSLMAIEIKQGLEREYDMVLTTQEIRNMKVKDLREMEATIAKNDKAGEKKKAVVSDRVTSTEVTCLPKGNFVRLNDIDAGKPIFLFPPFEGSFHLMSPVCKHIHRPIIGVNWTEEVEKIASFKDMVAYFVHLIRQNYPEAQHDLMGYDFGGLIALEAAAQMQNSFGDAACTKLGLIESSPDLMRSYSQDFIAKCRLQADQADDTLLNNLLVEYMHMFFTLEVSERHEIEQQLLQLGSSKDEKLQMICQMFDKKIAEAGKRQTDNAKDQEEESRCDPQRMREAVDRFLKKLQFAAGFEISRSPLPLTLGLQRASDGLDVASQLDPTYNLSKIQAQGAEMPIDTLEGDHRTMLIFNSEAIGHALDAFFVNVVCA